jgi:hypothetical protein
LGRLGFRTVSFFKALKQATLKGYNHFLRMFQLWAEAKRKPVTKDRLETLLLDYMDYKDRLVTLQQAVCNIEETITAAVASTLGVVLCAALAAVLKAMKVHGTALMTAPRQDGYFRPGEIIVAPDRPLEASETQTFDDTVVLDLTPWLGPLLLLQCLGKLPHHLVFNVSATDMVAQWKVACLKLGVPGLVIYRLRHGGASSDMLSRRRGAAEVMLRSHLLSLSSLRRYAKPGLLAKFLSDLTPPFRALSLRAHRLLQKVLEGKLVLQLPA